MRRGLHRIWTRSADRVGVQEPILALLRKHIDSKGKQAKLKSPQELQELLDVTRQLVRHSNRTASVVARVTDPDRMRTTRPRTGPRLRGCLCGQSTLRHSTR